MEQTRQATYSVHWFAVAVAVAVHQTSIINATMPQLVPLLIVLSTDLQRLDTLEETILHQPRIPLDKLPHLLYLLLLRQALFLHLILPLH